MNAAMALLLSLPVGWVVVAVTLGAALGPLRRCGFTRLNYQGSQVIQSAGLVLLLPLPLVLMVIPGEDPTLLPAASAVIGFAVLGLVDDRFGSRGVGGIRGHLGALLRGRLTTGALKAVGGGVLSLLVGFWLTEGADRTLPIYLTEGAVRAGLIALAANSVNLLDLRPLRALKGFWLVGLPIWGLAAAAGALSAASAALGALIGGSLAYAPREARRECMLGDAGSNTLGAALGVAAAVLWPSFAQMGLLLVLIALHAFTEVRSLSAWIDAHPVVAAIDRFGWAADRDSRAS